MRQILAAIFIIMMLAIPAGAAELTAPTVPEYAEKFMPENRKSFGKDFIEVLQDALLYIRPDFKEATAICMRVSTVMLCTSLLRGYPGNKENVVNLASCIAVAVMLLSSTGSLVNLAGETVREISEYGKLLLPVMTAAMAGQGYIGTSAALYAGTAVFDAILSSLIGKILTPFIYLFLLLAVAGNAVGDELLKKMRDTLKWFITWLLKTILYIYTGYIGISGVVSGTTDAATLKAAKLTISSVVPVVGGILSDASEAILIGAGTVKNTAGVYGLYAIIAIWIGPFLQIGCHYLLLKTLGGVCATFAGRSGTELIKDFSSALGLLLAMTGANCLMLLISLVCFLRGAG